MEYGIKNLQDKFLINGGEVVENKHPNVILILTDDQGYGDIGCNGNCDINTPFLDEMSKKSIKLTDYHTEPMCAPTRAAILTGQYSMRAGVWSTLNARYYLSKNFKTMPEYFKEAGYKTGIFGKWHMGDTFPYRAKDRGFDEVVSFGGGVIGETPDYWDNDYFDDHYMKNGVINKFKGYCTDVWFNEAIKFIEDNKNNPFFCYLPTNAPHDPYNVDEKYYVPYLKKGLSKRLSKFYGMITNIDENIGRLQEKLKELEIERDTIVLFMGDNGSSGVITDSEGTCIEGYNAMMRGKKGQVYEGSHKNNCFIQCPSGILGKAREVKGLTSVMDLLPTLIDCCGLVKGSNKFDGVSLYSSLKNGDTEVNHGRKMVIHCMQEDLPVKYKDFTILDDNIRFIKTKIDNIEQMMMFNMNNDYSQKNNIIADNLSKINEYMSIYEEWWNSVTNQEDYTIESIGVGNDDKETVITCHAWHNNRNLAYSQVHIRKGIQGSGYWNLKIEKEGYYDIELSRWPKEADKCLNDTVKEIEENSRTHLRPVGKIFDICNATVRIQNKNLSKELTGREKTAKFRVYLYEGKTKIQSWFLCKDGICIGAYYVYIKRVNS